MGPCGAGTGGAAARLGLESWGGGRAGWRQEAWVLRPTKGWETRPCLPLRGSHKDIQGQPAESCFVAGKVLVLPELRLSLTCFLQHESLALPFTRSILYQLGTVFAVRE